MKRIPAMPFTNPGRPLLSFIHRSVFSALILLLLSAGTVADEFPDFKELMKRSKEGDSGSARTPPARTPERPDSALPGLLPPATANEGSGDAAVPRPDVDDRSFGNSIPAALPDPKTIKPDVPAPGTFDWAIHQTSIADLKFPQMAESAYRTSIAFEHGTAFLNLAEEFAYLDLIDAIAAQRRLLLQQTARDLQNAATSRSVWEKAFYQFANARRLAWNNGHLRHREGADRIGGLPNPFTDVRQTNASEEASYSLHEDISRFPEDFMGRPVVLYGVFTPRSIVRIGVNQPPATAEQERSLRRQEIPVLRGALTLGDMQIAVVDTKGLLTPGGLKTVNDRGMADSKFPVLVKGWVVKKWDSTPLIYCESLRQISSVPHHDLIRQNTVDRRRLREEETWLYYETLRQLELTDASAQKKIAASFLDRRITALMQDIDQKTASDLASATARWKSGKIAESEFRLTKASLERRLNHRIKRYRELRRDPRGFQTYVDMFQFADVYHGQMVTLHGHVRHVVSYPGDETLFNGRMLHELWLFTDDSQHNPAVIITPDLPVDFPMGAEVIDRISVTGCFFKRYVYGSQDTDRIAPLLLAEGLQWEPTADQVQALVRDGHLSSDSPRAKKASALTAGMSRTSVALVSFGIVMAIMIIWGRAQREERDRLKLRKRVNEIPEFENTLITGYVLPSADPSSD